MQGLIGRKIGMTQIFEEDGTVVPVTLLAAGPCPVVRVKTGAADGYGAVQLAFDEIPARKLNRPELGHLKKNGVGPHRIVREFRTDEEITPGTVLDVSMFTVGDKVDVVGTTKGRGFQGVVKRHGFHGGPKTHGSKTGRIPGSIGCSAWPSRVFKGKKLPGHMGNVRLTTKDLTVVKVDQDRNLLGVRGAVPGSRNSLVLVHRRRAAVQKTDEKTAEKATGKTAAKKSGKTARKKG
jgi:large subunit ribosomal protein L3